MMNIMSSNLDLRTLDNLARNQTPIHRVHPIVKLITTFVYLIMVVSFGRYEISGLLPFIFYPVLVFGLANLPPGPILKRILFVEPFIISVGILNPFFDQQIILFGDLAVTGGWVTFLSIFIKGGLTVAAALLLIATTGIDGIAMALRMLKIPRMFVLQILLTYRYIHVLIEELITILIAYTLRAPEHKGISRKAWGSLAGRLLLRSFDRAQRVYQAMCLRGFNGEFHAGNCAGLKLKDLIYLTGWVLFFVAARIWNISTLIGLLAKGA